MADTKLKPCPFCGGEANVVIAPMEGTAYVECKHCSAMMGRYRKSGESDHKGFWTHFETQEKAIEAWNRRSNDG